MNEDYQNPELSLSSFQSPGENDQPFDSFDASMDMNDNPNAMEAYHKPKKPVPRLGGFGGSLNNNNGSITSPPGVISPSDSNVPNQGDIKSPTENEYNASNMSLGVQNQSPNQAQELRNARNAGRGTHEMENDLFSFRRERDQRHEVPERERDRDQDNAEHVRGERRSEREEIRLMSEPDNYDKTRLLFTNMKKFYVFVFLNVVCLGLALFNLTVAYKTENISFPKIEQIDAQFQQKVVLDINLIRKGESCSDAYKSSKMGKWPGYENVCECSTQTFTRECQTRDLEDGCTNLGPTRAVPIRYWDGKQICLRKSEKTLLEYYETSGFMESYNGNFLCPTGLKKCVVNPMKNFICVGRFDFCPIVQIEVEEEKDLDKNKYKAQLPFENKFLVYDNKEAVTTSFMDIVAEPVSCNNGNDEINQEFCHSSLHKLMIDNATEYKILKDNTKETQDAYEPLKKSDNPIGLYVVPMNYLDMCIFNNTFNPIILNSQLSNWRGVKYLLFINPYFITTLLVVNIIRALMVRYMNVQTDERQSQKRKKEIYNMFGRSFTGSSVVVITEVMTILYYIFWGYLLLNPDRLIAEKWLEMSCITGDLRAEIEYMIAQFTQVETYNMMTIGPMIVGCIMEALFSQYNMINTPYTAIHSEI